MKYKNYNTVTDTNIYRCVGTKRITLRTKERINNGNDKKMSLWIKSNWSKLS